jgi:hypothetical protein
MGLSAPCTAITAAMSNIKPVPPASARVMWSGSSFLKNSAMMPKNEQPAARAEAIHSCVGSGQPRTIHRMLPKSASTKTAPRANLALRPRTNRFFGAGPFVPAAGVSMAAHSVGSDATDPVSAAEMLSDGPGTPRSRRGGNSRGEFLGTRSVSASSSARMRGDTLAANALGVQREPSVVDTLLPR